MVESLIQTQLPEMLRVKDCAHQLKITTLSFYRMLRSPNGPRYRRVGKGRSIRIPRDSYLEWLQADPKIPKERGPKKQKPKFTLRRVNLEEGKS